MSFFFQDLHTRPIYDKIRFRYMICYGWLVHSCGHALSVWPCECSVDNRFYFFSVFLLSLLIVSASPGGNVRIIRSWYTSRWWVGCGPASPLFVVPNVTAHPSTASVPITVLMLYDGPLLCCFNVAVKGYQGTPMRYDIMMLLPLQHYGKRLQLSHETFMIDRRWHWLVA